jgi:hypothetical protein
MQNETNPAVELTHDQQTNLRNLLDSELVLVGGGEVIVNFG